jgi:threonine dehydrogenase-like Zn-dependent dehydrogenase
MSASVVEDLDLTAGERAVFVGDSMSPFRLRLLSMAGADNVVDVPLPQLATAGEADAILIDRVPDATSLNSTAAACVTVLRSEGRLVAVGSTPAGLYDADASTQAQQNVVGPALLHATMTAAGLLAQEPAERLAGPDPVRWSAAFRKP